MMRRRLVLLSFLLCSCGPAAAEPEVTSVRDPASYRLRNLPTVVHGRAVDRPDGIARQWPGSYFETSFAGRSAFFKLGQGNAILHVLVDGRLVRTRVKPAPGSYRVGGLKAGEHRLRLEVASESQAQPTVFGGFYGAGAKSRRTKRLARQIEFIGDSYTVGYGNASAKRE